MSSILDIYVRTSQCKVNLTSIFSSSTLDLFCGQKPLNKIHPKRSSTLKTILYSASGVLVATLLAVASASARDDGRKILVLTSTNDASDNNVVVFKLETTGTPSLPLAAILPTGGKGGASGNAGILQFKEDSGAVANYGSNTVSTLVRNDDYVSIGRTIKLASGCTGPDSVALNEDHLFVVGGKCAESHSWPSGNVDGTVVSLTDNSAGQIAVGETWAAVTLTSGSVLQLPLAGNGALNGTSASVALPDNANNTPLGAAFWKNILGFNPAHSTDSFALVDSNRNVFPVLGPQPSYPTNAPCWLAKGPGNVWYSGNSPGMAVSVFFSDGQGGMFYKSVPLPGVATDITVSRDRKWLAVIYTANDGSGGRIAVFSIDAYGDLSLVATSAPVGVPSFNGVAISQ